MKTNANLFTQVLIRSFLLSGGVALAMLLLPICEVFAAAPPIAPVQESVSRALSFGSGVYGYPSATKSKRRPAGGRKGKSSFFDLESGMVNVDVFVGMAFNSVSGDYLEYQKTYYETGSRIFNGNGAFTNLNSVIGGVQARIFPMHENKGLISQLSIAAGASMFRKGFEHNVQFLFKPDNIEYDDFTTIKETYKAEFLSTFITARFGKRIYADAGLSMDWFLGGIKIFEMKRATVGDSAFLGTFETSYLTKANLTKQTMAGTSLAWLFGIGGNITPNFGLRIMNQMSSTFFKESGSFKNYQLSIQATATIF